MYVRIVQDKIHIEEIRREVLTPECGAVVTFEGVVRNHDSGKEVSAITYEAYVEMAQKEMTEIGRHIEQEWREVRIAIVHRVGRLIVEETSVMVMAAAPHRKEAFEAARFGIDRLKEMAPIWKQEETPSGARWKS